METAANKRSSEKLAKHSSSIFTKMAKQVYVRRFSDLDKDNNHESNMNASIKKTREQNTKPKE